MGGMAAMGERAGHVPPAAPMTAAAAPMARPAVGQVQGPDGRRCQRKAGEVVSADAFDGEPGALPAVQPVVRTNFADTAFWAAALTTAADGTTEVEFPLPESLTTWKVKAWTLGPGTQVGQGEAEVITTKDLLVRLQAPRFFVQKDEVVLSANVHNKLKT